MYIWESWTIQKAEYQRIDAFELWCWRRLLRVPWTARSSNQSILKEINPEYSLEGLKLKLKLQHFGHLIWRDNSLKKTLMLGKTEGKRRGQERMRCLDRITNSAAAAAAAKSLQSCPTLCDPIDGSPWGSPVPGILQARVLEWGAIAFYNHQLNGHEFEQTPEDSEGQGSLACCSPWGCKDNLATE